MKRLLAPVLALAMFAVPAAGQEAPKPGPEHKRLEYFAGSWTFTGEAKDSPMGPGGALAGSDMCEWFSGGFQLVCRGTANGPRGKATTGSVWTYDPALQSYTLFGYSSMGESFYVKGSVTGKVWTWNAEFPMGGAMVKMRATVTEEPPAAYMYKLETSGDGTSWMLLEEGRATKKSR